jgi:hypothetical protein
MHLRYSGVKDFCSGNQTVERLTQALEKYENVKPLSGLSGLGTGCEPGTWNSVWPRMGAEDLGLTTPY